MSRALRKLQKEKSVPVLEEQDSSNDEKLPVTVSNKSIGFDLLMDDDLVLDESSSDHNANLNIPITSSNKKSKKSKKKKPKSAQPVTEKDEPIQNGSEEDEIDKAIREVNEKLGDLPKSTDMGSTERTVKEKSIFLIEYKHLDGDAEMKKQFGSIALRETRTGRKVKSTRRRALANPKSHWPRANPTGLSCELLSTHEGTSKELFIITGYSTFSFKHSKDYEVTQLQFIQAIETLNPNNIMEVLAKSPFHIDSNLQMSEILKQNGDITMASDFVERCLYAFEASLHPNFSLSAGNCRLEFNRIENRSMFVSIFRHIQYLGRRGCWRTCLEFQKLLYNLDPVNDPFGSLLYLDFFALKSGEYAWYENFWSQFNEKLSLSKFCNISYSIAMIKWELERGNGETHTESTILLKQAIARFPSVVYGLFEKMTLVESFMDYPWFQPLQESTKDYGILKLLIDMYIDTCWTLWKIPELLDWLKTTINEIWNERRNGTNPAFFDNALNIVTLEYQNKSQMPLSIQRTIVLSDNSTFGNRLPAGTMDSLLSFDPLPPPTAIDNPYTTRLTTQRESAENAGIIDRLMGFLFRPDGAPQNIHIENDFLEENDEDEGLDEDF
ncbi:transcriptional repressor TCF25-domain-containing protein [Globomyces pollinis-pini]|nr:transcriptional repressor TCF25-domain-containing protein [Globomyces pollinis-pini]